MWEITDKNTVKRKNAQNVTSKDIKGNDPFQEKDLAESPELSYERVRVQYSPPSPNRGVIQKKQTTPLAERLREQGIAADSFGPEIAALIASYDELENAASTRKSQQSYLYLLMDALNKRLQSETGNTLIYMVLQILQDELSFVNDQNYDTPPEAPKGAWEHMDSSPFLRMIAEIARADAQDAQSTESPAAPVTDMPPQEHFSSLDAVAALSRHHIEQLTAPDKIPALSVNFFDRIFSLLNKSMPTNQQRSEKAFMDIYRRIKETLLQNGMLCHYTHNPNLTVLHSTNYLKDNRILAKEKLSKSEKVDEKENVSKSQEVDTDMFRNTGFVFFFLEGIGSSRRSTDFGKYRYTVRLTDKPNILNNAWAILHDMAGMSSPDRKIQKNLQTRRIIQSSYDTEHDAPRWYDRLTASPGFPSDLTGKLFNMLTLFLPSANQRIALQTPDKESHETGIVDHISGNFLQGNAIIDGIAFRIAHELMTLQIYSEQEYTRLMSNDAVLWEYISGAVHDMQIMVPQDVLPTQFDFEENKFIYTQAVTAVGTPYHISGLLENVGEILLPGVNNCFFDAVFPLMNHENLGAANAIALRRLFTQRQRERGIQAVLPDGAPVEYQHVQQFVNIFGVTITVIAIDANEHPVMIDFTPQGTPSAGHYYIRFLPSASEGGIGHYTNL